MAYTSPRTWVVGEVVTAAQLNEQLRDNMIYTKEMAENAGLAIVFDGGGAAILAPTAYHVFVPGDATITGAQVRASLSSDESITIDIRRLADSDGDTSFTSDQEIIAGILLMDTDTGQYNKFTADTDWTTALSENDQLQFRVVACSGVELCTAQLLIHKG